MATTPPPSPPRTFTIAVDSTPRGISFTIDGLGSTTPFVGPLPEGTHRITMPRHAVIEGVTYNFLAWSDGDPNPARILNLQRDNALTASYASPVAPVPVAYDSHVGVLSLATNGGRNFLADSQGKLIVVYINGEGELAITVNNGDPMTDGWQSPFDTRLGGYLRPAAVLRTDDEMHVISEYAANIVDQVVRFTRDSTGNITNATFDPPETIGLNARYPAAIRAHDGSIWATWNEREGGGSTYTASRLFAGHWTPSDGWSAMQIAVDTVNTERFYSAIIEREDNFRLYVFANRGEFSADRRMAFVAADFSGGNWTWRAPNLTYETIASRGISDTVDAVWDPVRQLVVVVHDHTGTPSFFAFTLDSDDRKIHFDTPHFSIVNNDWGTVIVDSVTGDYYLLFMETVLGTVNGRACYSRWGGTDWSDLVVLDQQTDDIAFATRAGGGPMKDFIFGRGFVSGSVQIRYGRIP